MTLALRRWIKVGVSYVCFYGGLVALARRARCLLNPEAFGILMYHKIVERPDATLGGLPVSVLERQIRYVSRAYCVQTLEAIMERRGVGQPLVSGSLAVTFDDGHPSAANLAAPVLARYRVPATVFAVSGLTDAQRPLWTDVVAGLIAGAPDGEVAIRFNGDQVRYVLGDRASRCDVLGDLKARLKALLHEERIEAMERIEERLGCRDANAPGREAPLTWRGLQELIAAGWRVGGHTVTHPVLSRMSPEQAREEIWNCKRHIEQALQQRVSTFCYPNGKPGDFTEETARVVREAGFVAACTAMTGWNGRQSNPYTLRRLETAEPLLPVFASEVAGLFEPIKFLKKGWRHLHAVRSAQGVVPQTTDGARMPRGGRGVGEGTPPAVVLGFNMTGLSVIRNLGRHGVRVFALDSDGSLAGRLTRYGIPVILPDIARQEAVWLDWLVAMGKRLWNPGVLFPTGDRMVLFIAKYEEQLAPYFRWPLPARSIVEAIPHKQRQYELAAQVGIPQPKTWFIQDPGTVERLAPGLPYPCCLKPLYSHRRPASFGEQKFRVVSSGDELRAAVLEVESQGCDGMIQEVIPGGDDQLYGLWAYIGRQGTPIGVMTKRKLRQFPVRWGDGSLQVSCFVPEVASLGLRFLQGIGFTGLAGIEFKRDPRDGQFKLMEMNARTESGGELAVACGMELPWLAYQDLIGRALPCHETFQEGVKWVSFERDVRAFWHYWRRGELTWLDWVRSLRGRKAFAYFAWDDPLPFLLRSVTFVSLAARSCCSKALQALARRLSAR